MDEALRWLEDIFEYIAQDNPDAAARTVQGIYERAPRRSSSTPRWASAMQARNVTFGFFSTSITALLSRETEAS
jgi:plasmid stabilization system protein ParE